MSKTRKATRTRQAPAVPIKVENIKLGEPRRETSRNEGWKAVGNQRIDVYFEGEITINGRALPCEVHLMNSDGSIKADRGKWNASIEINKQPNGTYLTCPECNGNEGCSGPILSGDTAAAVADVIFPLMESMGYQIARKDYTKGWWTFAMYPDSGTHLDNEPSRRRFYVVLVDEIDCPVHGKYVARTLEPAV